MYKLCIVLPSISEERTKSTIGQLLELLSEEVHLFILNQEFKLRPNSTILHYEEPYNPDILIPTEKLNIKECIYKLISEANVYLGYTEGGGI